MDIANKLLDMLTAIKDPAMQMFIALVAVLGVVGFALYVVALALKRGDRP